MRLGILGGRFDPPHLGHLLLAEQALETLDLDELWLTPAKAPPHKAAAANAEHRYAMTLLAVGDHPHLRTSRLELDRDGPSFTVDTLKVVRDRHPDAALFLILGADAAAGLPSWHRPETLVTMARVVVFPRAGEERPKLPSTLAGHVHVVAGRRFDCSSTEVRERVRTQRSVRYLVPAEIEAYVHKHGLYREA